MRAKQFAEKCKLVGRRNAYVNAQVIVKHIRHQSLEGTQEKDKTGDKEEAPKEKSIFPNFGVSMQHGPSREACGINFQVPGREIL